MWYKIVDDRVYINIKAKPNAKATKLCGFHGGMLKVALKAVPTGGKANEELLRFIATLLSIPTSCLELSSGSHSPIKRLKLPLTPTVENFLAEIESRQR